MGVVIGINMLTNLTHLDFVDCTRFSLECIEILLCLKMTDDTYYEL